MEPRFWSTIWAINPINQLFSTATKQPPFCPESTYYQSRRQQKAMGALEFEANLCFTRVFCKDNVWYLWVFHFIISLSNDRRRKAGSHPAFTLQWHKRWLSVLLVQEESSPNYESFLKSSDHKSNIYFHFLWITSPLSQNWGWELTKHDLR